ncbi:acyltransferase [Caballeronia sp. NK8]|uniref:acyltransferase family protein n=1 Tax=Caballeronia sp. NK8 TaxID=140098 RepID=UPI001BCF83F2|nr:acyltransferase [Caballeronia sp. NK8]
MAKGLRSAPGLTSVAEASTPQPPKLDFIDSMRGFAALYVLSFHFSLITDPRAVAPRWLAPFTAFGGSGVTLFFVVSAFTLCLSMDTRKENEATPLLNYIIRRFFRIAPLFYLWIIVYCIRDWALYGVQHSVSEIARSAFFLLNLFPGKEQGFVWASWTIGVEMLFYVLFPAIFRIASNVGRAGALFLVALLVRAAWQAALPTLVNNPSLANTYFNLSLLYHLPTFVLGICVYRIYRLMDVRTASHFGLGYLLVAGAIVVLISISYGLIPFGAVDPLTIEAINYGVLLLGLSISAPRFLVNSVTRFYGKISYSVYLSHAVTIYSLSKVFAVIYNKVPYVTVSYGLSIALALSLVTLISWITYTLIETPGNRLGRAIIRFRRTKRYNASAV